MRTGPTLRAAAALLVVLALIVGVDQLTRRVPRPRPPLVVGTTTYQPTPGGQAPATTAAPATAAPPSTRAAQTAAPPATAAPAPPAAPKPPATSKPVAKVSVQILNAGNYARVAIDLGRRVRAAGYDVVSIRAALRDPLSKVYYTDGHLADALAFRARFPAFATVAPAPANLSRAVALHAVIGYTQT